MCTYRVLYGVITEGRNSAWFNIGSEMQYEFGEWFAAAAAAAAAVLL